MPDSIMLRPWQQNAEDRVKEIVAYLKEQSNQHVPVSIEDKALVMWLDPGMGKTLLYLHCLNYLFRIGFVECAAVYTPRVNLCTQSELDWKDNFRKFYEKPVMGTIRHAPNGSGMITEPEQFGFISTYQSLIADRRPPGISPFQEHAAIFERYPTALVVDEAQLLGFHGLTQEKNKSTEFIEMLAVRAKIIFVLTGTPLRADHKRLSMAHYSEKDQEGRFFLLPAVRASYLDGVKFGCLRPFEFELFDGRAVYKYLDGEEEYLQLTSMSEGLEKVLENRGWWSGAIDKTVEKVRELQKVYKPYCGLVACATQDQAREVLAYLRDRHPSIKSLLAISDEELAKDHLRQFKTGQHDILVTVAMAHIGYDYKPITVICCLTAVRNPGWLRQLFGRGWRWDPAGPEDQFVYVIAPDDRKMQRIVNGLREESQDGIKEREPELDDEDEDAEPAQPRLGVTVSAELIDGRAVGMDQATDVTTEEYPGLLEAAKNFGLRAAPMTGLMGLLRSYSKGVDATPTAPRQPMQSSGLTDEEIKKQMRREIKKLANRADGILRRAGKIDQEKKGYTNAEMIRRNNGKRIDNKLSMPELQKRIDWLNNFWLPYVEQLCNG